MEERGANEISRQDIINRIKELAAEYTPEWRFDEGNMDIGACLAEIYVQMSLRTLASFPLAARKNRISFLNRLGADMLPAKASSGYVTFRLVNSQVPGCHLPAGSRIYAETQDEKHKNVYYETAEDLFVSPAKPDYIYSVSDKEDYISLCYSLQNKKPFRIFSDEAGNLQEHRMQLCSPVFAIPAGGEIEMDFYANFRDKLPESDMEKLLNSELISISTYTEDGIVEFVKEITHEGALSLRLEKGKPEEGITEGKPGTWIDFHVNQIAAFSDFSFENLCIRSRAEGIRPDAVYCSGVECSQEEYLPFGMRMGVFQDVLFTSEQVLSKKGAKVTLRFHLEFWKEALETNREKEIEWNWIMDADALREEPKYEVSIGKVVWEYYNGNGFVRLFPKETYSDVFSGFASDGGRYQEVSFICPEDMGCYGGLPIPSYGIRARILSMSNEFKLNGCYVAPVLSDTFFSYEYEKNKEWKPEYIFIKNNLETNGYPGREIGGKKGFRPFYPTGNPYDGMYIGFQEPPRGEAVKMLFVTKGTGRGPLVWEYYGKDGFRPLHVIDGTEYFRKSGVITLSIGSEMAKTVLFRKERYWLRISDTEGYYGGDQKKEPFIEAIHMNSVKATAVEASREEYFRMKEYEAGKEFKLGKQDILDQQVYVEEGTEDKKWILWEKADNFLYSGSKDRHYVLEAGTGILRFGNGVHGMIPPASRENNIKILYKSGGGAYTNVKAGEISKMAKSRGYINKVYNFEAFSGGTDRESVEDAIARNTYFLRHKGQALTADDYEQLAREASPYLLTVSCKTGIDGEGRKKRGCVTLVAVPKQLKKNKANFEEIKEEIYQYLKPRMPKFLVESGLFTIRMADYAEARIRLSAVAGSHKAIYPVKHEIIELIKEYFNPPGGFRIGSVPKTVPLRNSISGVKEVIMVNQLKIGYYMDAGSGMAEKAPEDIKRNAFLYVTEGIHDIHIDCHCER